MQMQGFGLTARVLVVNVSVCVVVRFGASLEESWAGIERCRGLFGLLLDARSDVRELVLDALDLLRASTRLAVEQLGLHFKLAQRLGESLQVTDPGVVDAVHGRWETRGLPDCCDR